MVSRVRNIQKRSSDKTNYVHFRHNGGIYITTPIAEKHTATIKANYEIMGTFFDKNEIKLFKKTDGCVKRTNGRMLQENMTVLSVL